MATFKYLKQQALPFTLKDGQEFILTQGKIFELPSENAYIRDLITQGYLEEVPQSEPPALQEKPALISELPAEEPPKQKSSFKKR